MNTPSNNLFKLVALRSAASGNVIFPVAETEAQLVVPARLQPLEIDPRSPSAELSARLDSLAGLSLSEADIGQRRINDLSEALHAKPKLTRTELDDVIDLDEAYVHSAAFLSDYAAIVDSWLIATLSAQGGDETGHHENVIRSAHIILRYDQTPPTGADDLLERLRSARIALPKDWSAAARERLRLNEVHADTLRRRTTGAGAALSRRTSRVDEVKKDYDEGIATIGRLESMQRKLHIAASRTRASARNGPNRLTLVDAFDAELDDVEKIQTVALSKRKPSTGWTELSLGAAIEATLSQTVVETNRACRQIRIFEEPDNQDWRPPAIENPDADTPSVRALGFGDLIVAKEKLVGYDAREIAHIENALAGERRERVHEKTQTTEDITESETVTETETEDEREVTDRFELASETQKTIESDFSIDAGISTSGRYGLTKVETSASASFSSSKAESKSASMKLARDVVSRAVERTHERVREFRRTVRVEEVKEINRHLIDNTAAAGVAAPTPTSGVYLWVDKIHEVQLVNYGTRLMMEFHIPEPGASLLDDRQPKALDARKPKPFTISPLDIDTGNYLCLATTYGAVDIEAPPPQYIFVGHAWASTPAEGDNENTSEDTLAETVSIPDGYRPVSGTGIISAQGDVDDFQMYFAIGGIEISSIGKDDPGDEMPNGNQVVDFDFDPSYDWPAGVPLSLRAHGHFDKTMLSHARLKCERSHEAMMNWRISTWSTIRTAHQSLVREYEQAVDAADFGSGLIETAPRPESENRRFERDELKKWAISALRRGRFDFSSLVRIDGYLAIDPVASDLQAPITRFFEESFEWDQMTYFLYPYFWADPDTWRQRRNIDEVDGKHEAFLQAGAARLLVPVTPGFEERTVRYLDTDPGDDDISRFGAASDTNFNPSAAVADIWMEIRLARDEDLVRGSGTLSVQNGSDVITLGGGSLWLPSTNDAGRQLWITGVPYTLETVSTDGSLTLDRPYEGDTNEAVSYAVGSVPYGPSWHERTPTSMLILSENRGKLDVT